MPDNMESHYEYFTERISPDGRTVLTVICIEDLSHTMGGKSVTNNIEVIIAAICACEKLDALQCVIVFKDTEGNWDGWNPKKRQFYPVRTEDAMTACAKAVMLLQQQSAVDQALSLINKT